MRKKLDKQWWLNALPTGLGVLCTWWLMQHAGLWPTRGWVQFALYFFCYLGLWRCFSFVLWLVLLLVRPPAQAVRQ